MSLHPDVHSQIEQIELDPSRPLIISDADEVLFQFAAALEVFLEENGLYFDMSSFALTGNIKHKASDEPLSGEEVGKLIGDFFVARTEHMEPVLGAPDALKRLSGRSQIVVLTNVPLAQREARIRGLQKHGMDYPVIANIGLKGGAVKAMREKVKAPALFLDDIPHNIQSVAETADDVHLIHFIADDRLAKLLGPAEHSHHRADDWEALHDYIDGYLTDLGY